MWSGKQINAFAPAQRKMLPIQCRMFVGYAHLLANGIFGHFHFEMFCDI